MPKIAGIVIARMDSQRFPGKAVTSLGGVPLLERCLSGVLRSDFFTPILATTGRSIDQPLVDVAKRMGILYFRGDLDNVYQRVCECLKKYEVDIFARVNGDSPFFQADILDSGLRLLRRNDCDFVTNLVPRRFPYGVSAEIFRSDIFLRGEDMLLTKEHQEHITSYFYQNLKHVKYASIVGEGDLSAVRLTIDTPEDLVFIERMLEQEPCLFDCSLSDVVSLYQKILLTV